MPEGFDAVAEKTEFRQFGDQDEVDLRLSAAQVGSRVVLLTTAAVVLAVLAVRYGKDAFGWLLLGGMAALMGYGAIRGSRIRVHLCGSSFDVQGIWRDGVGTSSEFLGWDPHVTGQARLLRRRDLKYVYLPAVDGGPEPDTATKCWLMTYLPVVDPLLIPRLRGAALLSSMAVRHQLAKPLPADLGAFHGSSHDFELALAARSAEQGRYFDARLSLEDLLRRLPARSFAAQFVFDALRVVGDESSAILIWSAAPGFRSVQAHWGRCFCALATERQRAELEALLYAEDWCVQRDAQRALRRLGS